MSLAGAKRVERPSEHRLGVLFEISIVCHVLCSWFWWVAGVSPVWGCSGCPPGFWFSGSGLFVVLVPRGSSARLWGGGGGGLRVVPGSGVDVVRPVSIDYRVLVGGWACWARLSREVVSRGSGCARFLVCFAGVGRVFFRSALSSSSGSGSGSSVGVRVPGVGGFGGCRVGLGFFLRLLLFGPGRCRFLLGCGGWCWLWVVLVLFGEFDPGSGRTLAACLTHASRTGPLLWGRVEWRTGEYHVSNLPSSPG